MSVILLFFLANESYAFQDSSLISIDAKNIPIESVFREIEKQTGVVFYYGASDLDGKEQISLRLNKVKISTALDIMLKGKKLTWLQHNGSIVIRKMEVERRNIDRSNYLDTIPKVTVSGIVTDRSGTPLTGATVSLRGQSRGQGTNSLGQFSFVQVPSNSVLVVSSIGYETKQIRLSNQTELRIYLDTLIHDINAIEVVSTGYQNIPRERATGSFAQVDNATFNRRVGANILDRIIDVVPGLNFIPTNPGGAPINRVQIRGLSTINGNSKPLIVVDNFIYEGDLSLINPNDVESVTVLRDAAASSIWGVRAGNGVIVFTLKKGKRRKALAVSLNVNVMITEKPDLREIPSVGSKDIIQLEKKRFEAGFYNSQISNTRTFPVLSQVVEILNNLKTGKISQAQANAAISMYENADVKTEIERNLLQNQISKQYSLNISGGGEKYLYSSSIGYDQNRQHSVNDKDDRITLRFNNTWLLTKNLSVSGEINYGRTNQISRNMIGMNIAPLMANPYNILIDQSGNPIAIPFKYRKEYVDTISYPGLLDWHYIPMNEAKNGDNRNTTDDIRLAGNLQYGFLRYFTFSVYYQYQKTKSEAFSNKNTTLFETRDLINRFVRVDPITRNLVYPYPIGDIISNSFTNGNSWNFRSQLDFSRTNSIHGINGILGVESREVKSDFYGIPTQYGYDRSTNTYQLPIFGNWVMRPANSTNSITSSPVSSRGTIDRFGSVFGNASYSYNNKYTISASGRIDQSNFFGVKTNDRIVPLWSAGISWNIANEKFYSNKFSSKALIRATYGYSGNVNPGTTPLVTAVSRPPSFPLNVPFAEILTPANPSLKWERVKQINVGIDYSVFNNHLSGSIDIYRKNGIDLISAIQSSQITGFVQYTGNNASMLTKGVDIALNTTHSIGAVSIMNKLVFSYNTNKVTGYSIPPPTNPFLPSAFNGAIPIIGKPIDKLYTFNWGGLDSTGNALYYSNNRLMSSKNASGAKFADYLYSGRTAPPFFGSLRSEIFWKDISISIGFRYMFGHKFLRGTFDGLVSAQNSFIHEDYLQAWKQPGDEKLTNVPGFLNSYPDLRYDVYRNANILVESGSNIRLQDIRIDYRFDRILSRVSAINGCNMYVYINNIGVIWKESSYNPITTNRLVVNPIPLSIAGGFSISF